MPYSNVSLPMENFTFPPSERIVREIHRIFQCNSFLILLLPSVVIQLLISLVLNLWIKVVTASDIRAEGDLVLYDWNCIWAKKEVFFSFHLNLYWSKREMKNKRSIQTGNKLLCGTPFMTIDMYVKGFSISEEDILLTTRILAGFSIAMVLCSTIGYSEFSQQLSRWRCRGLIRISRGAKIDGLLWNWQRYMFDHR